jgi:Ras-related protein Rab-6A
MYDTFSPTYKVTIGIDFVSKNVYNTDGTVVRLQLWDTAGQERYRQALIPSYVRDSSVVVIVFDVGSKKSFTSTSTWAADVRAERGSDAVMVLVGNKSDTSNREVSPEEAAAHADALGVSYIETSAKTGENVKQLFAQIAQTLPHADSSTNTHAVSASAVDVSTVVEPTRGSCSGCFY